MDPLRDLCKIKDSFTSSDISTVSNIPVYSEIKVGSPRALRKSLYPGTKKYIKKDQTFSDIKDPFLQIDSFFKKRSSLVLADIDTIFNFSLQEDGYIKPQVINEDYNYAILDSDIGFLEYLQYRLPASSGFINCIDNYNKISKQFLNVNCDEDLTNYILKILPEGVNLVLSNTFDKDKLIQGIKVCSKKGLFIARFVDETPINYLYALTLYFSKFYLFKPFLENLNEDYSYFIAEDFIGDIDIVDFDNINVPSSFIEYIDNYNISLNNLKKSINGDTYNMYKCKALMNIF